MRRLCLHSPLIASTPVVLRARRSSSAGRVPEPVGEHPAGRQRGDEGLERRRVGPCRFVREPHLPHAQCRSCRRQLPQRCRRSPGAACGQRVSSACAVSVAARMTQHELPPSPASGLRLRPSTHVYRSYPNHAQTAAGSQRTRSTYSSAMSSARSMTFRPSSTSSSGVLSGGTTWMRLKLVNGRTPFFLISAVTRSIASDEPP